MYCGKAPSLPAVILLHVLQSSCLVCLGKMTLAQHKPCQDQLSVTLKLDFIYILCARVDLESSLLLHPYLCHGSLAFVRFFSSVIVERTCVISTTLGFMSKKKVGILSIH